MVRAIRRRTRVSRRSVGMTAPITSERLGRSGFSVAAHPRSPQRRVDASEAAPASAAGAATSFSRGAVLEVRPASRLTGPLDPSSLPPRIAGKIEVDDESGCWLWLGSLNPKGYGRVRFGAPRGDGRGAPARQTHRVVYELLVGPIPDGHELDHVRERGCQHRHGVNPAHLEPVTGQVNTLRGDGPTAINARKTHCVNGHEFNLVDTRFSADGARDCRRCESDRRKARTS